LWAAEGVKRPARVRKKRRLGPARGLRRPVTRPAQVWALDYQTDVTADGRQVRLLNVIDEFTREALAVRAARSWSADATVAVLEELNGMPGRRPEYVRMDNGPELTAHAVRD
jgi:putative transposase